MLIAWLACSLSYVHQSRFDSATPVSRLDLLHALVDGDGVCIDRYHDNTPDKAVVAERYYSDKAPGTAALAFPAFAATTAVARIGRVQLDFKGNWLLTSWVACAFSQALPAALGAAALFEWMRRFVRERAALVTVVALTLGSLSLPYSTLLFSHAQVIGLIGIAIWATDVFGKQKRQIGGRGEDGESAPEDRDTERSQLPCWRMALAGFCLGLALASEYTSGIVAVALVVYLVVRYVNSQDSLIRRGLLLVDAPRSAGAPPLHAACPWPLAARPLWCFFLAAVPPLLLIPAYSWATIGTPFGLPYSYQASFPEMKAGLYAIKWPNADTAFNLLCGPTRGLVFWTPFLVMAGFGWWRLANQQPR